jgi:hypothetical protein
MAKSMNLNSAAGLQGMLKDGHKSYEGVHGAVIKNIEAAKGKNIHFLCINIYCYRYVCLYD